VNNVNKEDRQIPIWFFIGVIVTFYGIIILATGIYHLFVPPPRSVALQELHADVWWPLVLLAIGLIYTIRYNPWRAKGGEEEVEAVCAETDEKATGRS